ncbi:hypothetical protein GIB67_009346 [Kingdonia uniflora]|uniref:MYND-type domain-containing protein n=1 Tax=Kingdonia uniflora TaxID=39325 RepID=A0A7J7N2X4_9MAGN|nr:hypothetical protein GIB67_009346 [Kingdonia uniflora]
MGEQICLKKLKSTRDYEPKEVDLFERLHDDLVISILCKLSSSSESPSDFISSRITCKRMYELCRNPIVLAKASPETFVRAKNWSESGRAYLVDCAKAGNVEACYTYGMILFYCFEYRKIGQSLIARAANQSHAAAMYSLAVIKLNGSGGADRRAGVILCHQAACLGHINALREFGHCLQDGYGISQNIPKGRQFLYIANTRDNSGSCGLLKDVGRNLLSNYRHPVNQFLTDWYSMQELGQGLRLCSNMGCGKPETTPHQFRRCAMCFEVNYCSRGCQMCDWKLRHKAECSQFDVDEVEVMLEEAVPEEAAGDT